MTVLPTLDLAQFSGGTADRQSFLRNLDETCRCNGFFYLINHGIPAKLLQGVLEQSRQFFDLPAVEKNAVHIRHSHHFRGYSQMKNVRDWREQIHFGQERSAVALGENTADYYRLVGPNSWPELLGAMFRDTMLAYLDAVNAVGQQLLSAIAQMLGLPENHFTNLSGQPPYLLMKLICYYAQPDAIVDRPGVAPHCDWSWLTILLQDDVGGLEVLSQDGAWQAVTPAPGALSVNLGELIEILTGGQYRATAHRVINPSEEKRRISVPVFINPALEAFVEPMSAPAVASQPAATHIHRVVEQGPRTGAFQFGASEWERKGLGKWCYNTGCLQH